MDVKIDVFLITVIFSVLIEESVSAKMQLRLTKFECPNFQPDLVKNVSCRIGELSDGSSSLFAGFSLTEDVWEAKGTYVFTVQRGSFKNNRTIVEIDYCNAFKAMQSDYFLKLLFEDLRQAMNMPLRCPFKKDTYYHIDNYTVNTKLIPSYAPELSFISHLPIYINKKKSFSYTCYGTLARL